ncbi:FGFR1 oncogene partner isoform X2 [Dunckerocampus dactyliophorus]|uniref:FGFR1 oncogene partner isoform X2 n=1 Tax=Dunckerocampus dactyliophorus TaxID=161453 RepID=UPI0024050464|nr:FGFR1 oncogene partner isoform X2 [Dunckerocampus dactyliophorus]
MSAAEDDTELRDLLIQNLENNGVLNKLKAEMRAAVFLALEEQDQLENKTPLVNDNLKKCLNTKDGRLVASLIVDFLQVFHLDFSLAVFQPEINTLSGLDSRQQLCSELGLPEAELNTNSPLLLELVRRGRHKFTSIMEAEVASGENRVTSPPVNKVAISGGEEDEQQDCKPLVEADSRTLSSAPDQCLDVEENVEDHQDEDDSFFDDPLPKPQKTYGWQVDTGGSRQRPEVSLSEAEQTPGGGSASERSSCQKGFRDQKVHCKENEGGSLNLEDDMEYNDDDFNSHRSDHYKSELSISEDIEEVSIEGPDNSDKEDTVDLSVSQLSQSHGVDYMEEVA